MLHLKKQPITAPITNICRKLLIDKRFYYCRHRLQISRSKNAVGKILAEICVNIYTLMVFFCVQSNNCFEVQEIITGTIYFSYIK